MGRFRIVIIAGAFLALLANGALADTPASVQLVGNFAGITCEPDDPANNMQSLGDHVWRALKFINEPGNPDTIYFKFTRDGSYLPKHWGWSGTWGIADYSWSPPSIAAVLPDSGYYYFYFNDADYTYWLERPAGSIYGSVTAQNHAGVPDGTCVTLFDSTMSIIGTYNSFSDDTYSFDDLSASVYAITANAPGYRDTTITGINLGTDEAKDVPIYLEQKVGVLIASADCERTDGGVRITWCTMDCSGIYEFDVYRGCEPDLSAMEKRNDEPITSSRTYEFFDSTEDPTKDLYYYLVELAEDNPTRYGPIYVAGAPAAAAMLGQNYPNPFNPTTTIPFTIGANGAGKRVTISFYDVTGKLVDGANLGIKQTGDYTFMWNPSMSRHGALPSGVYYCRLQIDKEIYTRKVILLR
ncbi:MAG: T9SS type A sorting domain-containing protein [Candidatus Krumholzibacteria bacterium]|nr:T9SS type A sorting domain-containing protein [Candidatus Krumholzibacteria bacterium]